MTRSFTGLPTRPGQDRRRVNTRDVEQIMERQHDRKPHCHSYFRSASPQIGQCETPVHHQRHVNLGWDDGHPADLQSVAGQGLAEKGAFDIGLSIQQDGHEHADARVGSNPRK